MEANQYIDQQDQYEQLSIQDEYLAEKKEKVQFYVGNDCE